MSVYLYFGTSQEDLENEAYLQTFGLPVAYREQIQR
jgi:hypothetical protein